MDPADGTLSLGEERRSETGHWDWDGWDWQAEKRYENGMKTECHLQRQYKTDCDSDVIRRSAWAVSLSYCRVMLELDAGRLDETVLMSEDKEITENRKS